MTTHNSPLTTHSINYSLIICTLTHLHYICVTTSIQFNFSLPGPVKLGNGFCADLKHFIKHKNINIDR